MHRVTSAEVYASELDYYETFHLTTLTSVFQAEPFAALMFMGKVIPTGAKGEEAVICSETEAMIKAIMSPVMTSKLVEEVNGILHPKQNGTEKSETVA